MYGQVSPCDKSSIAIIKKANRISQCNDDATFMTQRNAKDTEKQGKQRMHHKDINNLKLAFSEYYLMLVLLQKYQLLNFTGFIKILKKHDKLFATTRGDEWR